MGTNLDMRFEPLINLNGNFEPYVVSKAELEIGKEDEPMTERGKEIKDEIYILEEKIAELKEELATEDKKALAEKKANEKFIKYEAYREAGFDNEEAFELMLKEYGV